MFYHVTHPKFSFAPMAVVSDDPSKIVNSILDTSTSVTNVTRNFNVEKVEEPVDLDPGGILFLSEKEHVFEVDGVKFGILLSKIDLMLSFLKDLPERLPGYTRFATKYRNVIVPTPLVSKLIAKLEELNKTDAALHARLDFDATVDELEKAESFFDVSKPREVRR